MKKDHKKQLQLLKDWYKPTRRGEQARKLLDEHPDLFN